MDVRRFFKVLAWFVILTMVVPSALGAAIGYARGWPANWRQANWSSSGALPDAATLKTAKVIILASRTGQWKSIFAEHMSLVMKRAGESTWTRFDVVGWGQPVRENAYVADAYWYGNTPRVIYELDGDAAEQLIPAIKTSIHNYPNSAAGSYMIWPGPNSNTFVSWVVRHTDGFNAELSPVAVGKDYLGPDFSLRARQAARDIPCPSADIVAPRLPSRKASNFTSLAAPSVLIPMILQSSCPRSENLVCGTCLEYRNPNDLSRPLIMTGPGPVIFSTSSKEDARVGRGHDEKKQR